MLDPRQRFTTQQALRHPFIVQNCGLTEPPVAEMAAYSISSSAPPVNAILQGVSNSNPLFDRVSSARNEIKVGST